MSQSHVRVEFQPCNCLIGSERDDTQLTECECICHEIIRDLSINCPNYWISYTNTSNQSDTNEYLLTHCHCPYDYCPFQQYPTATDQPQCGVNMRCNKDRTKILCGSCQPGLSVSFGSSKCMKCGDYWPATLVLIIIVALVAGIALVALILFLNITVAVGTINGVIFYANIINANSSAFLRDSTLNFPSVFISWLNLDIGFDICLYDGIDTYEKTWLQLVFPIYLIFLVVLVIVISNYSQKFSNLTRKRNPVATLAT